MLDNNFEEKKWEEWLFKVKTYGLTNNFNQLKLKYQNNELLQFYRTMKKLSTKNTEKSAFFQDLLIFMIMVGMVGMPIMPIMNLSKSGKLTFQKKGLQLFYQQRQQHFQKTWNIHLKWLVHLLRKTKEPTEHKS